VNRGRVYLWIDDPNRGLYGRLTASIVPLRHLEVSANETSGLTGRFVCVRNGGAVYEPNPITKDVRAVHIGDARPDAEGDFLFEPGHGGGRIDKVRVAEPDFRWRYIQASRFGEVNTYFHVDRIATYVHDLLHQLGAQPLPSVTVVVNAHHAATEKDGLRDGVRGTRSGRWLPFQGGHYRLPGRRYDVAEFQPISPQGEIHLGPGWQLLRYGAIVELAGRPYWANAAHNGAIIYHEYGHHILRHTADIQANQLRLPDQQRNRKAAIDEGTSDYWAATMLGTPHIWAWHRRHDDQQIHPRSLASTKTMADYDSRPGADPHSNGTIWAAALWDLRTRLEALQPDGARRTDLLVLQALLLLGQLAAERKELRRVREKYETGLATLIQADNLLNSGRNREAILTCFGKRGIHLTHLGSCRNQLLDVWK
jgi:fungalysin metallopeptidase (M36)